MQKNHIIINRIQFRNMIINCIFTSIKIHLLLLLNWMHLNFLRQVFKSEDNLKYITKKKTSSSNNSSYTSNSTSNGMLFKCFLNASQLAIYKNLKKKRANAWSLAIVVQLFKTLEVFLYFFFLFFFISSVVHILRSTHYSICLFLSSSMDC